MISKSEADEIKRLAKAWALAAHRSGRTGRRVDDEAADALEDHIDSLTEPELEDLTDELRAWSGEARQIAEETLPLAVEVWPEPERPKRSYFDILRSMTNDPELLALADRVEAGWPEPEDVAAEARLFGPNAYRRHLPPWPEPSPVVAPTPEHQCDGEQSWCDACEAREKEVSE